ncbi:MAG: hypothetical protein JRE28_03905 [Deltaproteobacteria bacterium]|nr:hypothetical protein [Deltaproteobacteria bacterium]
MFQFNILKLFNTQVQRISRDLHDHVAQDLSALKIGYKTLFDNTPGIPSEIRRKTTAMSKILVESIKAVRDLAYDLRPPVLDEMSLVQTLLRYCHDFSENNIRAQRSHHCRKSKSGIWFFLTFRIPSINSKLV